eukprot:2069478-Rhodomonas_salina.3
MPTAPRSANSVIYRPGPSAACVAKRTRPRALCAQRRGSSRRRQGASLRRSQTTWAAARRASPS